MKNLVKVFTSFNIEALEQEYNAWIEEHHDKIIVDEIRLVKLEKGQVAFISLYKNKIQRYKPDDWICSKDKLPEYGVTVLMGLYGEGNIKRYIIGHRSGTTAQGEHWCGRNNNEAYKDVPYWKPINEMPDRD